MGRRTVRRGVRALAGVIALATVVAGSADARADVQVQVDGPGLVLGMNAASLAGTRAHATLLTSTQQDMLDLGRCASRVTPPKPRAVAPVKVPAHGTWQWKGWVSGASGQEALDGSFGTWRGKPVGVVAVWSDTTEAAQTNLYAVESYSGYQGDMDVSVGAFAKGGSWADAAAGAYVDRWTTAARNLRRMREGKGTTYVRFAHEFNGDWMPWGVKSTSVADFKKAYRLFVSIYRKEFPQARMTFSPNGVNHTDVSIEQMWPGRDVVDVIGPDIYDGYPDVTSAAVWKTVSNRWSTPDSPAGINAWRQYALAKGLPIAVPEWGLPYGDHPAFVQGMHDVMSRYPAARGSSTNAGRFVYDVFFNAEDKFKLVGGGANSTSAAMYRSLTWGS